ncbi:alpha-mannosidase 2 [Glossina fuscipes fuscipes]
MLRLKRRLALTICAIFMTIFSVVYFLINYAAPQEDKKPSFMALENKVNELENGLKRHHNEMQNLKTRLEQKFANKNDDDKEVNREINLINKKEACTFDIQRIPQPDIQMLEMYTKMTFADVDGGAWKQGWNIKYDPMQYNDHHKLKVFVVPHSHNDPGWTKTFEDYYVHETKHILSNALRHLKENPEMKFIWAEISYFSRFFEDVGEKSKQELKKLVANKQLEFVTGGWVMPDEANAHWHSIIMQLTEGQTWLKRYFNITPVSSWAIDPFGHSPAVPYILKKAGFKNLLIQRTHYSIKKELALNKQLEFYWRQLWDDTGSTDIFTHMMPFYSYDIPHSCGPDPKVCCQFDFKRISGFGLSCPWRISPKKIRDNNVAERAGLLVDQWKKKAELYNTNVVLFPLGDDFRYSQNMEWEVQRVNYEALFAHINGEPNYFVEARFGTLQEYFDAVHQEQRERSKEFPILSGDFFTYADRADNYWSGYYTSRPYHKRMDRVLMHYIRSAAMLHAWTSWSENVLFDEMLQDARRQHSLFQHHDGITGTAKTHVVEDYAKRMLKAVNDCRFVMQQSVYRLLTKSSIYNPDPKFNYFYLDDSRWPGPDDSRTTIILAKELPSRHLVFHNSLPNAREELVDFYVASLHVSVTDLAGNAVETQISPAWTWHKHSLTNTVTPQASTTKYRLLFKVKVPPMGLSTYVVNIVTNDNHSSLDNFATNLIMAVNPIATQLVDYPKEVTFSDHREISLKSRSSGITVAFTSEGMIKSIQLEENELHTPVRVQFFRYGTRFNGERSGAYLFLPNGPATPIYNNPSPVVLVTEGPLESTVSVGLSFGIHKTILRDDNVLEIHNDIDISNMDDTEVVMRFQTRLQSSDTFYTDLNGLEMIKRQRFSKIPLQANYYPIPSAIYIEDDNTRLTVVTAQPLGGSSLAAGEIEIMQDRRLTHDDDRGLGQGILDNQPVLHIFRIILEKIHACEKLASNHPSGALTLNAFKASKSILNPLDKFIYTENEWFGVLPEFGSTHSALPDDVEIVDMRNLALSNKQLIARNGKPQAVQNTGIIIHRTNLLQCPGGEKLSTGELNLQHLLQWPPENVTSVYKTTITFLQVLERQNISDNFTLCPMDTLAFIIQRRS